MRNEEPERGTRNRNEERGTGTRNEEPERGTRLWNEAPLPPCPNSVTTRWNEDPPWQSEAYRDSRNSGQKMELHSGRNQRR